jgi:hypothetical protein
MVLENFMSDAEDAGNFNIYRLFEEQIRKEKEELIRKDKAELIQKDNEDNDDEESDDEQYVFI